MDEETAAQEIPVIVEEVASSSSLPLIGGLAILIILILLSIRYIQKSPKVSKLTNSTDKKKKVDNKVTLDPKADAAYLVNCLRPTSTPLEILYAIATTPDTVAVTSKHVALANELREKKLAHLASKQSEASHKSMDDLFDDDGWAEEDEDDPAAAAAKKAKEEKEKEEKRLAKATGKDVTDVTKVKLEGVDDGVLGQEWVVSNLTKLGVWPPPGFNSTDLNNKKFTDENGKKVSPLNHPGVKRALIMTMGRLNAKKLNTHPELMAAGPKGLIDPTYFQATMEYRQRVGQVLEGTLRMACTLRSYRLASSILDAIVMFKIGLMDVNSSDQRDWFNGLMVKQYGQGGTPKLILDDKFLGVPTPEPAKKDNNASPADKKEEEKNKIAQQIMQTKQVTTTDEKMALEMTITRQHAESFTKEKLAAAQKQGIPPQIAMQAYREAWFILVRARKVDDTDGTTPITTWDGALGDANHPASNHMKFLKEKNDSLYKILDSSTISSFTTEFASTETNCENRIVIGWPFVISNVAQKTGKVKIHLPPPVEAGKYEFCVTIKSQEFLGVEEEFKLVVDVAKGVEKKKKDVEVDDTEGKKDK